MRSHLTINIKNLSILVPEQIQHMQADSPDRNFSVSLESTTGLPAIGAEYPEQGGIFAGVMPAIDGHRAYGLIVATDPAAESEELAWGNHGKEIEGASSAWDGAANTAALVATGDSPAAAFCTGLKLAGFGDWYLAARRESSLMAATVPHLFKAGYHWTSTQYSAPSAFFQDFSDGDQDGFHKDDTLRVRAVRRFLID